MEHNGSNAINEENKNEPSKTEEYESKSNTPIETMTEELLVINDELTEQLNSLEKENKYMRKCLTSVEEDVLNLEVRIRALEEGRNGKEHVSMESKVFNNTVMKII